MPGPCKCQNHKISQPKVADPAARLGCTLTMSDLDGLPRLCKYSHAICNPAKNILNSCKSLKHSNRNREVEIFWNSYLIYVCTRDKLYLTPSFNCFIFVYLNIKCIVRILSKMHRPYIEKNALFVYWVKCIVRILKVKCIVRILSIMHRSYFESFRVSH